MKLFKLSTAVLTAALMTSIIGCSKNRTAEGLMDTPQAHFDQGKKYWDKGENDRAQEEFKLALSLDKDFAPGHAGMALVTATKASLEKDEDKREDLYEKSEDFADEALDLDDENPYGHIAMGIRYQYELTDSKDEDWYEKPEEYFEDAIEVAPKMAEPHYRLGVLYKSALKFGKAEKAFRKVLDMNELYTVEANDQWELVQKINRAAPGTKVGRRIALVDEITKADVAALFISELELDRILEKRVDKVYDNTFEAPKDEREMQTETTTKIADILDIDKHWAKNFILDLHNLGVRGLTAGPDHKFYPAEKITRSAYSMFIEAILVSINNEPELATKHLGNEASRFKDVPLGTPYYNAICNMADMGIMKSNLQGEIQPMKKVSGADALLIIRRIKELRK